MSKLIGQLTCSQRGVLKTLLLPNLSASPVVQRKTPPKLTSSPKTNALSNCNNHQEQKIESNCNNHQEAQCMK